jgi:hypothetical protein
MMLLMVLVAEARELVEHEERWDDEATEERREGKWPMTDSKDWFSIFMVVVN